MSEEKLNWLKAPALSTRSLSVLSSLNSVFRNKEVSKQPKTFVLSREFSAYNNHIKWLIEKSSLDKKGTCGQYIESPSIKCSWPHIRKFLLYPNGKKECYKTYVSINITFRNLPKSMSLLCEVAVLGKDDNILTSKMYFGDTNDLNEINFEEFFRKSCLDGYLVNDKLTIMCMIKCISKVHKCVSDKNTYQAQETSQNNNSKRLLVNGKHSDVVLKLDSKNIKLHKFILASESPALTVLLKCCNEDIFDLSKHKTAIIEDLLSFIYTGNIEILKFNHICQLYITADEFGVLNLRDICSVFLSNSLTKINVPYMLNLSTHFKDQYLIDKCLKYLKENNIKSDAFIEFQMTKPFSFA